MTNFSGELVHLKTERVKFPIANVANASSETYDTEIEIFPSAFFKLGMVKLPVLKEADIKIVLDTGKSLPSVGNDGAWFAFIRLYNSDSDDIGDDNIIAEAYMSIKDVDSAATIQPVLWYIPDNIEFGENGMLLRPTNTLRTYLYNTSGAQINAEQFRAIVNYKIDWNDVDQKEFDDYIRELWYAEEFD